MKNTYLNCEIANDDFSQEFLESIKVLSSHPIIKIHSRKNGITSGKKNNCYWNSSILSQTFGGKVVFGYCISETIENSHKLYGHGCWLTPEGNLVDVTQTNKEWRYFLPLDQKLVLNGKFTQAFRDLYFISDLKGLCVALFDSADSFDKTFERTLDRELQVDDPLISKEVIDEKYLNTLITCDSINEEIIEYFCPELIKKDAKAEKYWKYLFRPLIKEINQESNIIYDLNLDGSMDSILKKFIKIAMETGKSFFEIAYERKMYLLFPMWEGIDETWSNPRITEDIVSGISTSTGKSISDYSLHPDVLRNHPIPKDPQLKNELKNRVNKLNRYSKEHISYKEFLVLSDPYLYPHPSLVEKITSTPLEKSPLKRIAV